MTSSPHMVDAQSVSMQIRHALLLDNVSLQVGGGECVAIVGPNGAGKSTLLRLLSGDLAPTGGNIELKGRNLASYASRELACHRAMLSQHVNVSFPFSVDEIVRMGAGDRPRAIAQAVIDATIAELELEEFRHRELPTLSGGEQQRAHFARVLVQLACGETDHGAGVLFLDEPTSSLDLRFQIELAEVAKKRARSGTAVVAVLHDLNLAARFADRIVVVSNGKIVADGRPTEIVTNAMIRTVFDVETEVGLNDQIPYVLPQRARASA